ncbi:hypothetical protein CHUAL_010244 [Chamberlinius hualienensis]
MKFSQPASGDNLSCCQNDKCYQICILILILLTGFRKNMFQETHFKTMITNKESRKFDTASPMVINIQLDRTPTTRNKILSVLKTKQVRLPLVNLIDSYFTDLKKLN